LLPHWPPPKKKKERLKRRRITRDKAPCRNRKTPGADSAPGRTRRSETRRRGGQESPSGTPAAITPFSLTTGGTTSERSGGEQGGRVRETGISWENSRTLKVQAERLNQTKRKRGGAGDLSYINAEGAKISTTDKDTKLARPLRRKETSENNGGAQFLSTL